MHELDNIRHPACHVLAYHLLTLITSAPTAGYEVPLTDKYLARLHLHPLSQNCNKICFLPIALGDAD